MAWPLAEERPFEARLRAFSREVARSGVLREFRRRRRFRSDRERRAEKALLAAKRRRPRD